MAPTVTKKYKAAAVNAEPGWLDLELSVEKTIHWINEAGKNGCKLVAFPELCKSMRELSPFPLLSIADNSLTFVIAFADWKYRDPWYVVRILGRDCSLVSNISF
jgi:predicted amidohydrolase